MSPHAPFNFADAAALLDEARRLHIEIPFSVDTTVLCTPLDIAGRRLPNRLIVHPLEGCDAGEHGQPGELTFRRYGRFAAGGSGLIWFEATAVVPEGRANPHQLQLTAASLAEFQRLVESTRRAARESLGHNVLCILQLTHAGRYARPDRTPRPITAQHNPVLDARQSLPPDYPLITDTELDRLQDAYVRAAALAAQAGFDGVDIKACHGYLVSELLAAHTRSDSRYGGTFENRARFLLEVIRRVREACPGLMVTSRISAHDGLPYPFGFGADPERPGAEDLAEAVALVRSLEQRGCPLLSVSIGNPYYQPHWGRPFDRPVAGMDMPDEHPLVGIARLLRMTAVLQQAVPRLPIVGTGYSWLRQFFPHVGAAMVQAGKTALIGVGRLALAYPDYAADLLRRGGLDPAKVCDACSGCSQIMRDGGRAGCVRRDSELYAAEYRRGRQRARRKTKRG